jgi:hypothetical protein
MPDRQDDLNPASDLAPFADALQRLAPQPPHLSRDALLFAAGKAAAQPRLAAWVWPTVAAGLAALSLVLGAFAISPDPEPRYVERVQYVYVPAERAPGPARAMAADDSAEAPRPQAKARSAEEIEAARMLQVRRDVLRWGIDMLPESPSPRGAGPSQDVAARELTRWLNLPPGTFALPALQPKKPDPKDDDNDP